MSSFKNLLTAIALGTGLLAFGCTTGKQPAQSAQLPAPQAITCAKCQVTYVNEPTTVGKNIVGYHHHGVMECPDCKDQVTNFFTTGKFVHTCKTCGPTMSICDSHNL